MTKLRSLSSLSLARLRKRRLLHVDNMQVKKRGRFFDFDSMEGNVLRLSECNANALGLLLLNALHASDENRIVSVCVVPSSSTMTTSNSSSYRNTTQNKSLSRPYISNPIELDQLTTIVFSLNTTVGGVQYTIDFSKPPPSTFAIISI